ncbi:MAG: maleylacetoacetate isomerase [Polyangiaceae bacterium]
MIHKQIEARYTPVNLLEGEQNAPGYKARSPMGFVPALDVDGRLLTESVAILEYLEEVFPQPALMPKDAWLRGRARQLVEIVNAGTQPLQNLYVLRTLYTNEEERAAWSRRVIARGLDALETTLAEIRKSEGVTGPFSLGEGLTVADLFLVPQLYNARRFKVDLAPYPLALSIEAAALATPSGQASHPDKFRPE